MLLFCLDICNLLILPMYIFIQIYWWFIDLIKLLIDYILINYDIFFMLLFCLDIGNLLILPMYIFIQIYWWFIDLIKLLIYFIYIFINYEQSLFFYYFV